MNKRYLPTYLADNLYEIPFAFYQKIGVHNLLLDLDNTLAPYGEKDASPSTLNWVKRAQEAGLSLYIASNNTSKRVRRYSKELGIPALGSLRKPFASKLKKILKKYSLKNEETILIGDQIMTDILSANGAKIRSILTKRLSPKEPWVTTFNRIFGNPKAKAIEKHQLVKSWKEAL